MQWLRGLALGSASWWLLGSVCCGAAPIDYLRDVKPLLEQRCFTCHGGLTQESGLRLDTGALLRQGGDSGPAVRPGAPEESLLIQRISDPDDASRMPPEGPPLAADEIDRLRRWIAEGALSPVEEAPQPDPRDHWAFQPIERPAVPKLPHEQRDWSRNPIDSFILDKLLAEGIAPVPETDKATLLRRVTFDLTGLPPTPEELRNFLADDSPTAYAAVVDRLLASPRYGERWGRHWMDVWRYSDWYGRRAVPDVMNSYPHIWRWRDWIVRSLNADKGYDRMILEMLAADEIAPGDDENVVATGFLVRNWFKWNYETWMKDNVEHTGKAFLGLTLNCCQCHDHKYDPITQREYFQFRAFFEPLELRQDRVPQLPDPGPFEKYVYGRAYGPIAAGMVRVFDEKLDAETWMHVNGDARNRIPGEPPAEPKIPAIFGGGGEAQLVQLPPEAWYPGMKEFVREETLAPLLAEVELSREILRNSGTLATQATQTLADLRARSVQPATAAAPVSAAELTDAEQAEVDARLTLRVAEARLSAATAQVSSLQARIAADDARHRHGVSPEAFAAAAALAEKRAAYEAAQLRLAVAEKAVVLADRKARSDAAAQPEAAAAEQELAASRAALDASRTALRDPGTAYAPLSPIYPSVSTGRRAALAGWIASPANPLTARVAVNHLWQRHFGRGLVATPANFGASGKPPSHPELLDWLAAELRDQGWRMKSLHRLIVSSRTYRLRSNAPRDGDNPARDPDNSLYWRANVRRLEAECVRDGVLACAEMLDETQGGPEIDHAQGLTTYRRSLYFASHGESQMPFLDLFDGPQVCDCYERTASIMPQQALALANSGLLMEASKLLAERLWDRTARDRVDDESQAAFVACAFERILGRLPSAAEQQASLAFLRDQAGYFQSLSAGELSAAGAEGDAPDPARRARENLVHALLNHNDFITIR